MGEIKYIYSGGHVCKAELLELKDEGYAIVRYPDRPWVKPVPVRNRDLYATEDMAMTKKIADILNEIQGQKADIQFALEDPDECVGQINTMLALQNIDKFVGQINTMLGDYWANKRAESKKGS